MSDHLIPFFIDRSKWLRGNPAESMLLNAEGRRCCVGFWLGQVHEVPDARMFDVCYAAGIDRAEGAYEESERSLDAADIYRINDDPRINDGWREASLIRAFATIGYRPIFVDGDGR